MVTTLGVVKGAVVCVKHQKEFVVQVSVVWMKKEMLV